MIKTNYNSVNVWLFICAFLVLIITIIGGYTRLAEAGLSIVEWNPICGAIPPLNNNHWLIEFSKYQLSPEYKLKNYGISLHDFKRIFLIEYLHRMAGRITGIVFFLPFLYFILKRKLSRKLIIQLSFIFTLGMFQAFIGWYMVKSGLKNSPHVSHYRLSLHLGIAMIIYASLIWVASPLSDKKKGLKFSKHLVWLALLIFIQMIIGAFVSGLKGGLIYNTFPLMGSTLFPQELWYLPPNPLDDPVFVQFVHRVFALLIFLYTVWIFFMATIKKYNSFLLKIIFFLVCTQCIMGIATLLLKSPWQLALLHQIVAVILLTFTIITIKTSLAK